MTEASSLRVGDARRQGAGRARVPAPRKIAASSAELQGRWPDWNGVWPSSPARVNCGSGTTNRSVFPPQSDGYCQVPLDEFARVRIECERGSEHVGLSAGEQRRRPAVEKKWHSL